jgi:hypothetical protein
MQCLSNEDCINTCGPGNRSISSRGNLLMVTKDQAPESWSTILMQFEYEMFVSTYTGKNGVCSP